MKKDVLKIYLFSIILLIMLFLALYAPNAITRIVLAILLVFYTFFLKVNIKKKGQLSVYKKQVTVVMFISAVVYLVGFYMLGIYFGFYRSPLFLKIATIIKYIIPTAVIVIFSEITRSILIQQSTVVTIKSKRIDIPSIILFIAMTFIDVLLYKTMYRTTSYDDYLTLIGLIVFASASSNLLYNYISKRFGATPIIVFRLITILYFFILPIIPDVYTFFRSFLKMLFPYFIYVFLENSYAKTNTITSNHDKKKNIISTTILLIFMALFVMLISCKFYFGILVVGSKSMTGSINMGDAIIYKQYNNQSIKKGQVIVFNNSEGSKTIHRVIKVKNVNGEYHYYTKGDANQKQDDGYILKDDVVGIVELKISYIGYPTIWVRELFKGGLE